MSEPTFDHLSRLVDLCEGVDADKLGEMKKNVLGFLGPNMHFLSSESHDKLREMWVKLGCRDAYKQVYKPEYPPFQPRRVVWFKRNSLEQHGAMNGGSLDEYSGAAMAAGVAMCLVIAWFIYRAINVGRQAVHPAAPAASSPPQSKTLLPHPPASSLPPPAATPQHKEMVKFEEIYHQNSHLADASMIRDGDVMLVNSICGAYSALYAYYIATNRDWKVLNKIIDVLAKDDPIVEQIKLLQVKLGSKLSSSWWYEPSTADLIAESIKKGALNPFLGDEMKWNTVEVNESNQKFVFTIDDLNFILNGHTDKRYIILITLVEPGAEQFRVRQGLTIALAHGSNQKNISLIDTHCKSKKGQILPMGIREEDVSKPDVKGIIVQFDNLADVRQFIKKYYPNHDTEIILIYGVDHVGPRAAP